MKHSFKASKQPLKKQNDQTAVATIEKRQSRSLPRWLILALCMLVPAAGVWAALEFMVWNKLPPALVGKWVVEGGPQDGATFDFSRRGTLEAHLNNQGTEHVLEGNVTVQDRKLFISTQNPKTLQYETRSCNIRELTEATLVVEFEEGEAFKMARAR